MPMRWRWPPENSCGNRRAWSGARPTSSSSSATRVARGRPATFWIVSGSAIDAPTVIFGSSDAYGSWNTICISRRSLRSSPAPRPMSSWPWNLTEPDGRLDQPQQAPPDRGLAASRSRRPGRASRPALTSNDTPDTACTVWRTTRMPFDDLTVKCLTRSVTSRTGSLISSATLQTSLVDADARGLDGRRTAPASAAAVRRSTSAAMRRSAAGTRTRSAARACSAATRGSACSRSRPRPGSELQQTRRVRVGRLGRTGRARVARSAARPAYITCTRSATRATTPRSWVISTTAVLQLALDPLDHLEDLRLHGDVERRGRLVGDQHLGIVGDRHRDHHALAHAAGELVRVLLARVPRAAGCRPGRAARRLGSTPPLGSMSWCDLDHLDDLVADPVHRVQRRQRILEDHRDLACRARARSDLRSARRPARRRRPSPTRLISATRRQQAHQRRGTSPTCPNRSRPRRRPARRRRRRGRCRAPPAPCRSASGTSPGSRAGTAPARRSARHRRGARRRIGHVSVTASAVVQLGVEGVAQSVADEVDAQRDQHEHRRTGTPPATSCP